MAGQLVYTSVPAGLNAGTRGFTTVAATSDLTPPMVRRLEALSAYRLAYNVSDPRCHQNPVAFNHVLLELGGQRHRILSRICSAGVDYSGRSNILAHHLLPSTSECPPAGPAWLLAQPGTVLTQWSGPPRRLQSATMPQGNEAAGPCRHWHLLGDAGWAGVLIEAAMSGKRQPVQVIFSPDVDLLALFREALALMPAPARWAVTFSTYFQSDLPDVVCQWRGIFADDSAARSQPGRGIVIDLTRPLGRAPDSPFVQAARLGQPVAPPKAPRDRVTGSARPAAPATTLHAPLRLEDEDDFPAQPEFERDALDDVTAASRRRRSTATPLPLPPAPRTGKKRRSYAWLPWTVAGVAILASLVVAGVMFFWTSDQPAKSEPPFVAVNPPKTPDPGTTPQPSSTTANGNAAAAAAQAKARAEAWAAVRDVVRDSVQDVAASWDAVWTEAGRLRARTKPPDAQTVSTHAPPPADPQKTEVPTVPFPLKEMAEFKESTVIKRGILLRSDKETAIGAVKRILLPKDNKLHNTPTEGEIIVRDNASIPARSVGRFLVKRRHGDNQTLVMWDPSDKSDKAAKKVALNIIAEMQTGDLIALYPPQELGFELDQAGKTALEFPQGVDWEKLCEDKKSGWSRGSRDEYRYALRFEEKINPYLFVVVKREGTSHTISLDRSGLDRLNRRHPWLGDLKGPVDSVKISETIENINAQITALNKSRHRGANEGEIERLENLVSKMKDRDEAEKAKQDEKLNETEKKAQQEKLDALLAQRLEALVKARNAVYQIDTNDVALKQTIDKYNRYDPQRIKITDEHILTIKFPK